MYKKQYHTQKAHAKERGIGFDLTYEEWLYIWTTSGHLHQRGSTKDGYVMSRVNDEGPYRVGNVFIQTHVQNIKDRKYSPGFTGHKHTEEFKERMRGSGNPFYGKTPSIKSLQQTMLNFSKVDNCKYCGRTMKIGLLGRWHNDKCPNKSNGDNK